MHRTLILLVSFFAFAAVNTSRAQAQSTSEEYGKCGYFADALQGRKTASGEKYDKNLLTCAHKTLPFNTQIRVTRLDNKKSVLVRVNDRGPYIDGYVVDLSRKAAEKIGLTRDGVTRVKIEVVPDAQNARPIAVSNRVLPKELEPVTYSNTAPAGKSAAKAKTLKAKQAETPVTYSATTQAKVLSGVASSASTSAPLAAETYQISVKQVAKAGFGLQVSSLNSTEKLFQEVAKLQATWPGKVVVNHEEMKDLGTASFKLILGPYATRKEAEAQQRKASSKGYKSSFVISFSE